MAPITQFLTRLLSFGDASFGFRTNYQTPLDPNSAQKPTHGAIACENDICADIGARIYRQGGNAIDATIATTLCVGVIGSYHSGIGGGGFALVRSRDGHYEAIDFRESAPAASTENMYQRGDRRSVIGGLAAGVPGELRGLAYLHKNYASLPWKELVLPAAKLATNGWKANADLVRYMTAMGNFTSNAFLTEDPNWAMDMAPYGHLLREGELITRKRYGKTLATIAEEGVKSFYEGDLAKSMIDAVQKKSGIMTLDDLKNYQIKLRNVSQITYRGHKMSSPSSPSSGTVALSVIKTLETYKDLGWPETYNVSFHRLIESIKWAYAARTRIGDPDYVEDSDFEEHQMLNMTNLEIIRSKISDNQTYPPEFYNPDYIEALRSHGTSQISASDASGLAISLTSTVNTLFGSQVLTPDTGIIMNNEMDDFSIPGQNNTFGYKPSKANLIRPHKRPLSSITVIIVEKPDGSVYFVTGAAGGSRIPTATIQSILNVVDRNMTTSCSIKQPRLHTQVEPAVVALESGFDAGLEEYLKGLGHNVTVIARAPTSVHAIRSLPDGGFEAVGETRQMDSAGRVV
ncbi:gamma-glutamyltransferase [Microthyrium microscopicum]|uniref:Glutathione hydrolase n=1 Tax=Microthyrium microscopicum TaxID=703497 RepID=A0A6A6U2J7_9PEZI|nr:gamma-glutamyltransferase [Microthyrium microscopicum]